MQTSTIVLIVIGVLILIVVAGTLMRNLKKRYRIGLPTTMEAWKDYFRGHFLLLLFFLVVGAALSALGIYVSSRYAINVNTVVKQYQIDPSKPSLLQENIRPYTRLIFFARALPENTSAKISLFRNRSGETGEVHEIPTVSSSTWHRVDFDNNYSNFGLLVEPPKEGGPAVAKQVEVFIYLSR